MCYLPRPVLKRYCLATWAFTFLLIWHQGRSVYAQDTEHRVAIASLRFTGTSEGVDVSLEHFVTILTAKPVLNDSHATHPGDYLCGVVDEKGRMAESINLGNPLLQRYEFPTDDHSIGTAEIPLQAQSVIVRFPYSPTLRTLQIARVTDDGETVLKQTLTLPETHD